MPPLTTCIVCGLKFYPHRPKDQCCSRRCSNIHTGRNYRNSGGAPKESKPCSECGKIFEGTPRQVVCSRECSSVRHYRLNRERKGLSSGNHDDAELDMIANEVWARKAAPHLAQKSQNITPLWNI